MSSQEIDEKICSLSEKGEDIYKLVVKNVSNAKPDLIISQEICEVCSAYTNQVKNAIEILDEKPEIYSMSPHDVQGILKCVKDIAERIDEVQRGEEIVNSLNSRIRNSLKLTCSVGITPNKLLSKIASDYKKPDGLTTIKPEQVEEFLSPLKIREIPGIGKKTEEVFTQMNVHTIEELREIDIFDLNKIFGRKTGGYIFNSAKGIDLL